MPCYILHFSEPYKHAKHYIGWARDYEHLAARISAHLDNTSKQPLIEAAHAAGITFTVAVWTHYPRHMERKLKNAHARNVCPCCRGKTAHARQAEIYFYT